MSAPTWSQRLDRATADEVAALLDAATEADGTAPVDEHVAIGLHEPGAHLLALGERHSDGQVGERLVGYARLERGDPDDPEGAGATAEVVVHPDARRRGVGTALVRTLLTHDGAEPLRIWAHGEHPGAVRLAATLGFEPVRALWQMRRALATPPLPEPAMPDGTRLRAFVVGQDEAEFLRVNNAAFDWHPEQGGWDVEQVRQREQEPWFDPAGFLLAVNSGGAEDGRLLGYHWTKMHDFGGRDGGPIGEVYVVGVDPAAQGRKLGAALTVAGLRHLRGRGLDEVLLYVEADNAAAVRVYEKLGFTRWHTDSLFAHR